MHNISQDEDGESPWLRRHGDNFKGNAIPFGCGVWFLPAPTKYDNPKAAPKRSYGIFLGYKLVPGGKWNGEYLVCDISDMLHADLNVEAYHADFRIWPHTTERVDLGKRGFVFPMKPRYEIANMTIGGVEDAYDSQQAGPGMPKSPYDEFGKYMQNVVLKLILNNKFVRRRLPCRSLRVPIRARRTTKKRNGILTPLAENSRPMSSGTKS